jgi:hypothetical protein
MGRMENMARDLVENRHYVTRRLAMNFAKFKCSVDAALRPVVIRPKTSNLQPITASLLLTKQLMSGLRHPVT